MKREAALPSAQARVDDNLAIPFGCNEPPFEFFCANGERCAALNPFRACGPWGTRQ